MRMAVQIRESEQIIRECPCFWAIVLFLVLGMLLDVVHAITGTPTIYGAMPFG